MAILAIAVLGATMWALQSPKRRTGDQTELYNVDRVSRAEELNQLPTDYRGLPTKPAEVAPVLGPPLPGDLGAPMLKSGQVPTATPAGSRFHRIR